MRITELLPGLPRIPANWSCADTGRRWACLLGALLALAAVAQTASGALFDDRDLPPRLTLLGHTDGVLALDFSPDGRSLASASHDGTIRLWDVETGKPLHTFKGHTSAVYSVSFSRDGKRLASGSLDQTARVWDVSSGDLIAMLRGQRGWVRAVFLPDGKLLSGARDGILRVWDVDQEKELWRSDPEECVVSLSVDSNGTRAAYGACDGVVRIWDLATHKFVGRYGDVTDHAVDCVALSPDGKTVYVSGDNGFNAWDVASRKPVAVPKSVRATIAFGFMLGRNGASIASTTGWVESLPTGKPIVCFRVAGSELVHAVALSTDGRHIAFGGGGSGYDFSNTWRSGRQNEIKLFDVPPPAGVAAPGPAAGAVSWEMLPYRVLDTDGKTVPADSRAWASPGPLFSDQLRIASGTVSAAPHDGGGATAIDVFCLPYAVMLHSQPGIVREVMTDPKFFGFSDVAFDGQNVWVASKREGIIILTPDGKVVARLNQSRGLPRAEVLALHIVGPGRILAGGFGWCAMIDRAAAEGATDDFRVNVFVREEQLKDGWRDSFAGRDPEQNVFAPQSFTEPPIPPGGHREIWALCASVPRSNCPILRIDPQTLTFSNFNFTPKQYAADRIQRHMAESMGSQFFWTGERTFLSAASLPIVERSFGPECIERSSETKLIAMVPDRKGSVVSFQDQLYLAGNEWYRIDPRTRLVHHLGPGLRSDNGTLVGDQAAYYASARYGLAAFSPAEGCFYRISVDPAHPAPVHATRSPLEPLPALPGDKGVIEYNGGCLIFRCGLGELAFRDGRLMTKNELRRPNVAVLLKERELGLSSEELSAVFYRLMSSTEQARIGVLPAQAAKFPGLMSHQLPQPDEPKLNKMFDAWSAAGNDAEKEHAAAILFAEARAQGELWSKDEDDYLRRVREMLSPRQWQLIRYEDPK